MKYSMNGEGKSWWEIKVRPFWKGNYGEVVQFLPYAN